MYIDHFFKLEKNTANTVWSVVSPKSLNRAVGSMVVYTIFICILNPQIKELLWPALKCLQVSYGSSIADWSGHYTIV